MRVGGAYAGGFKNVIGPGYGYGREINVISMCKSFHTMNLIF